jgi:hypothetical protein
MEFDLHSGPQARALNSSNTTVTRKPPGRSMRNSKQKDDDCISDDSFGSDFDNATDDENLRATLEGAVTELDSPPPVYSEENRPQSMSLLSSMDVKFSPVILQYTPPTETEPEPAFNMTPNPSICVVRGIIFNNVDIN